MRPGPALPLAVLAAAGLSACGGASDPVEQVAAQTPDVVLRGGGEVFPPGLDVEWAERFAERDGTRLDLQPLDAERGLEGLDAGRLLLVRADRPLDDDEVRSRDEAVLHVPVAATRVAVIHNADGVEELELTGGVLAKLLMGRIQRWNAGPVRRAARTRDLPAQPVVVCHASEPAPQTLVLSTWLSGESRPWRKELGEGRVVRWPTGTGAPGDEEVANCVRQNPGAIGYVDGGFAHQERLRQVDLRNGTGEAVGPGARHVATAVGEAAEHDDGEMRLQTVGVRAAGAYPLTGVSYVIVGRDLCNGGVRPDTGSALTRLLRYVLGPGQRVVEEFDQVPLPPAVRTAAREQVGLLRCGERLLESRAGL